METIIIKKKQFEIIEKKGERTFKLKFKDRYFFARYFPNNDSELDDFIYIRKRLNAAGISVPKFLYIDKKTGYIVMEYIDGENAMETLIKGDLPEIYYDKIFIDSWLAKTSKITLSFKPEHFILKGDKLYYLAFIFHTYDAKNDLSNSSNLRLWFYTKEFMNYISEKGYDTDKKRLIDDYQMNKNIVLTACKYHR